MNRIRLVIAEVTAEAKVQKFLIKHEEKFKPLIAETQNVPINRPQQTDQAEQQVPYKP